MEYLYIYIFGRWGIYFLTPRVAIIVRTRGSSRLALLLDEGVTSSSVRFYPIYTSFSPISFLLIIRENLLLQGLHSRRRAFITFVETVSFHETIYLLSKSLLLLLPLIFYFYLECETF